MPEFRLRIPETGRWPASAEAIFKILHNTGLGSARRWVRPCPIAKVRRGEKCDSVDTASMDQHRKCLVEFSLIAMVASFGATSARAQGQLFVAEPASRAAVLATPIEKAGHAPASWKISLTALAAANVVDAASSWNKHELNPALAGPSATFGWPALGLKMGITGAVLGIEWLATRHGARPGLYRALSIVNFGGAAAIGAVAGHNFTIPASPH